MISVIKVVNASGKNGAQKFGDDWSKRTNMCAFWGTLFDFDAHIVIC